MWTMLCYPHTMPSCKRPRYQNCASLSELVLSVRPLAVTCRLLHNFWKPWTKLILNSNGVAAFSSTIPSSGLLAVLDLELSGSSVQHSHILIVTELPRLYYRAGSCAPGHRIWWKAERGCGIYCARANP